MPSYLAGEHLDRLRQQVGREVCVVMPVQALVGMVTSYVGPEDVVHGWLREHGPIAFADGDETIVFGCDGAFTVGTHSEPVEYYVAPSCKILFGCIVVSLRDDPVTQYSTYDCADKNAAMCECRRKYFTCAKITSINGKAVLLSAGCKNSCTEHPIPDSYITVLSNDSLPGCGETLSRIRDMDVSAGRVTKYWPSVSGLEEFANLLATFAFPEGFERGWVALSPWLSAGIIQFNSESDREPLLYRTDAFGYMVPEVIDSWVSRQLQPMFSFIRPRRLGIRVTRNPVYKYTLVDRSIAKNPTVLEKHGRKRRGFPL